MLYLTFNEGYLSGGGTSAARREAAEDAVWLSELLALAQVAGVEPTLREVQALASELEAYHLWHAVYAELAQEVGQRELARAAELRALELTHNPAEQSLLKRRLASDAC